MGQCGQGLTRQKDRNSGEAIHGEPGQGRGRSRENQSLGQHQLEEAFSFIHQRLPGVIIAVDNCYCEFCEINEPTAYGADIMAGSLIKNPGGGLAPTGGYVAGKSALVERVAQRLTVPGLGAEVGSYAGDYRVFYQGLFMAPHTVAQCLKSVALFAACLEQLGFETLPAYNDPRSDIVESIRFGSPDEAHPVLQGDSKSCSCGQQSCS